MDAASREDLVKACADAGIHRATKRKKIVEEEEEENNVVVAVLLKSGVDDILIVSYLLLVFVGESTDRKGKKRPTSSDNIMDKNCDTTMENGCCMDGQGLIRKIVNCCHY